MGILETVKGYFTKEVIVEQKSVEDIGGAIAPIFREIPPDSKAGKFLREGARSWAYIAMSTIADEIATTPINLYSRTTKNDWLEVESNQILDVINKPNPMQTKEDMFWLITMFLLAEGEAPIMVDNEKNPTQFVLLNPDRIKINYDASSIIGSYTYHQTNGRIKTIPAGEVIFLKFPNVLTPFRGMGVLKFISQTLDIDNYIEEYLRVFFFNDATPGSVLQTEQELTKGVIQRLKQQLKAKHQGYKKAHKNLVLEKGLKWQQVQSKLNELQFKDLQDMIRDKILAAFKVPKSVLGIVEDVNRANGEAMDYGFAKRCVYPRLKMIESQLNQFFVPKYSMGENLWLEFENPIKGDELLQAQIDQIYVNIGVLEKNEIRARMELEPLEEKDVTEAVPPKEEKPKDENAGKRFHKNPRMINRIKGIKIEEEKKEEDTSEVSDAFKDVMKDFINKKEPKNEFSQEETIKYHEDKIAFTDKVEHRYKEKLQKFFNRQENNVVSQVKGYKGKKGYDIQIDEEKEAKVMAEISIPFIEEVIEKESELAYALVGLSGNVLDTEEKLVRNFIEKRTLKLGKSTAKTTKEDIQTILRNWSEEQGTVQDLRSMLRDYFDGAKKSRVDTIARTEISRAVGFSQEQVYHETGAVGKKWITAKDEMVCEFCGAMDGQTTEIKTNYWDKGETMVGDDGGKIDFSFESISTPPLHPNCRCDLIPVYHEGHMDRSYKNINQSRLEIIKKFEEEQKTLEERKKSLDKLEINLVEKEQEIAKKEIDIQKDIEELEKLV